MPQFEHLPYPCRYNTLRLLGYHYNSTEQLCAITLVTDLRRPVFADMELAKSAITSLLSDETLAHMRVRAFTLMPNHLHFLAGVRQPQLNLSNLIGSFKSFTTKLYWTRCREIIECGQIAVPSQDVTKTVMKDAQTLISALIEGRATLRPEVVNLRNWPLAKPEHFLKKHLWQARFFDHVIRNDNDLQENLNYIAMNPVQAGYVTQPCFYPYTGFLE